MPAKDLEAAIGHPFARPELIEEALTHSSALAGERRVGRRAAQQRGPAKRPGKCPGKRAYERLEFLGDRVLGLVVADLLWRRFDNEPEGDLTRRHAHLVCRDSLARVAEAIGLAAHVILSPAEAAAGAAANPGILADVCEAVIGALYLDGGFDAAFAFIRRCWEPLIAEMTGPPRDPKTTLQEWAQARGLARPDYALVATSGPDHARRFTVAASVAGGDPAHATASSKRAAEIRAAALLLDRLSAPRREGTG